MVIEELLLLLQRLDQLLGLALAKADVAFGGARIRNISLGAAFLAARYGSSLTIKHAMSALRREYKKMGKILMEQELRRDAR